MESFTLLIFQLAVLLMSIVIHEFAHGWMAFRLGDSTAKNYGRLTLNPLKHLDIWGSLVVPFMIFVFSGGQAIFGWAKPVPFNPNNLRDQKYGIAKVAAAGPSANLLIALIFGLVLRFNSSGLFIPAEMAQIFSLIVFLNILLAIFNLIPIPPLDGSKILFTFLPYRFVGIKQNLERYSMFLLMFFILFLWEFLFPLITFLFSVITGIN